MRGTSKTKFCKGTDIPKHSGNYSYTTVHYASVRKQTWRVWSQGGTLVVGQNTPLASLMSQSIVELAMNDPYFDTYVQKGTHTHGDKQYEAYKSLHKNYSFCAEKYSWRNYNFTYEETIYTDGDFEYNFPNY